MSDNIPPEVITKILSKLPVKSLLRFRCVCKSFKSLIDSPRFIKAHVNQQITTKPNSDLKLILKGSTLYSLDFNSVCSKKYSTLKVLKHPLKNPYGPTQVQGSCHGLVLISNHLDENGVWNPSTNKFLKLPIYSISPPAEQQQQGVQGGQRGKGAAQFVGGFGYDYVSDDYKVVRIAQWLYNGSVATDTIFYSLKSGVWKKVEQDFSHWLVAEDDGTYAGGVLHWIASKGPPNSKWLTLVGLNLATERYEPIPLPENLGPVEQLNLAVLGERLCLLESKFRINRNARKFVLDHVDVWVLKKYGVEESWTKLFTVNQLNGRNHFRCVRPVAYSETRRDVLLEMDKSRFLWYNIDNKSIKPVRISGALDYFETHVCLGTLVPVDGGGNEKDSKEMQEPETGDGAENIEEGDDLVIKEFKPEI